MLIIHFLFLIPPLLVTSITCANNDRDYYTSVSGLEDLLELESHLFDNLKDYVDRERSKYDQMNVILEEFVRENRKASVNPDEYFSSPVNVFRAIKRSVVDFKDLNNYILERTNEEDYRLNVTEIEAGLDPMPKEDDLSGAVKGLTRLQKTYGLEARDLARGTILGTQYSSEMSGSDLFHVGRQLYETDDYEGAFGWLSTVGEKLESEIHEVWSNVDKVNFLEYFSAAAYGARQKQLALNLTKDLLLLDSNNENAQDNLHDLDMDLLTERNIPPMIHRNVTKKPSETELYEATCRGERRQSPTEERPLRCMYANNNVPFLKLAPFKMEQLSLEPLVVYYHDVIYESEIERVYDEAIPYIARSMVGYNASKTFSSIRTSKNTWLFFEEHPFLVNLRQRLADMTQMSLDTAEALQVANYGIGGHYGPHYDFSPTPEIAYGVRGNRIATALFYISKVEHGGATAFPYLKLAVKPIRRGLVFWHNLHNSTDPDYRMLHAGCPVLKGSKWILNIWLHVLGQESNRPCGLHSTAHLSADYKNAVRQETIAQRPFN